MSQRSDIKSELTDLECPIPLDHTTPELAELLETVRAIPRDEAGKIRKTSIQGSAVATKFRS